jgi:hypothetical protein
MRRLVVLSTLVATVALAIAIPATGSVQTSLCSTPVFRVQVNNTLDKAQEAFDWYRAEAYAASVVAMRKA